MAKSSKSFHKAIIRFLLSLEVEFRIPKDIKVLNPYLSLEVQSIVKKYYQRFYSSSGERIFIFGINPGRFGAGITGISFTDPVQLQKVAGISHHLPLKSEISSQFVYEVIAAFGGMEVFAEKFFLTALCPLGFTKNDKNYNYYDDPVFEKRIRPFILKSMKIQMDAGACRKLAICLGEGQNYKYFNGLNEKYHWFNKIVALPHPRWIMQYRRKDIPTFINEYVVTLNSAMDFPNLH